jgi:undecaprenyl pyrophosphate phosphatase UppP
VNVIAAAVLSVVQGVTGLLPVSSTAHLQLAGPWLHHVRRDGFAPFASYRIALGSALLVAIAGGWMRG